MSFITVNPYTEQKIKSYDFLTKEKLDAAIIENHMAFKHWKETEFSVRSKLLNDIASSLEKDVEEHARLITIEMGKPIKEARGEVLKSAWACRYYAGNAKSFLQNEIIDTDHKKSFISFEPLGSIFGIMPWNFPYWQVFRFVAPSIMAGNVCLLKHALNVTGCALKIEELVKSKATVDNVFKTLIINNDDIADVIADDRIKAVTFTGSDYAGSIVAKHAGENIKKTVLELGGSDPFIVLDDADIDRCVKSAIASRFLNAGQSCIAAKRFIVENGVYKKFVDKIKHEMNSLLLGNPQDIETRIGPLAKEQFVDEIDSLVQNSISKGARLLIGGEKTAGAGFFYKPTLLIDVTQNMDVFSNETFGPVLCISKVRNSNEAIRLANQSCYGLSSSIWTQDRKLAQSLSLKINSGAVFINSMSKSDPRLPFGGINKSGFGRELSKYGLYEFVNKKTVVIN